MRRRRKRRMKKVVWEWRILREMKRKKRRIWRRKELLAERKVHIGSLASNFLEAPQERMINLEKLVKLVDSDQPVVIEMTVHRIAAASVLEILKDVTPGFKITHQEARPNEKLKKDTLKLQKYESA